MSELWEDLIRARVAAQGAGIERACEAALQGGTCGVMYYAGSAWVDARVPYGVIWDVTKCGPDHPQLGPR